jgi:hypothetical protein
MSRILPLKTPKRSGIAPMITGIENMSQYLKEKIMNNFAGIADTIIRTAFPAVTSGNHSLTSLIMPSAAQ